MQTMTSPGAQRRREGENMPGQLRGSTELLRKRWANPLPDGALDTVAGAIDIEGVRVNDVFCLGMPSPEFITGTATVKKDVFDTLSNNLLRLEACQLLELNAFPCGIPVPDEVRVDFRIGR